MRLTSLSWGEITAGWASGRRLMAGVVPRRCVLVIEPNQFHAELLPGYCDYLRRMGFRVFLLLRRRNRESGVFSRIPVEERPEMFVMGAAAMRRWLRRARLKEFELVLVTSTVLAEAHGYYGLFFDFLGFTPNGEHGYLVVEHNFSSLVPAIEAGRIERGRVILLSPHVHEGFALPMVNPHYFGVTAHRGLGGTRTFITVGSGTTRNRDFQQLVEAVNELEQRGVLNFRVFVVGRNVLPGLIAPVSQRISLLGYLSFENLYSALDDADFFLPLLDPDNPGHRRYLSGETTGSRQLILGFGVVPVINEVFADAYRFSETNAVLYPARNLADAMLRSIRMSPDEYAQRRGGLAKLAEEVQRESLRNLADRLAAVGSLTPGDAGPRKAGSISALGS